MVELELLEFQERGDVQRHHGKDGHGDAVSSQGIHLDIGESSASMPESDSAQLLGVSQPFTLQVVALSGQLLFDKEVCPPDVPTVQDLVIQVAQAMTVSVQRVHLLYSTDKLTLKQDLSVLARQEDPLRLLALVSMDGQQTLEMGPGRVTSLRLQGRGRIEIDFEPGEITEAHCLPLSFKHAVIVRSDCETLDYSASAEGQSDSDVRSMTLSVALPRSSLEALLVLYLSVSVRTHAMIPPSGEVTHPRVVAFRESQFERCGAVATQRLGCLVLRLAVYWVLDALSLALCLAAAVTELAAQHVWQGLLLLATLWLPGFTWACRYHCYCLSRKFVGIGSFCAPPVCCALWCSGCVWAFVPLALLAGAVVVSGWHLLGLLLVLVRGKDFAVPFKLENLYLCELYKGDVQLCGDLPRLILLPICLAVGPAGPGLLIASLASSATSGVVALLPHRRALRADSFCHFDEITMELVSD